MYVAKKLQYNYWGRCHLQEETSSLETLPKQSKKSEDGHSGVQSGDMWTLKANCKQFDSMNNQVQYYSRPKRELSHQLNLICEVLSELFDNKLDTSCLK